MFPLSGRFEAASKSNSSTLEPSRMTTRGSSGWLASISMRFVMEFSGARAHWAAVMGGRKEAARYVSGRNTRKPVRRNGHRDRDSVGRQRKSDSHVTRAAGRQAFESEPEKRHLSAFVAERWALSGAARSPAGIARACRRSFCRVPAGFQQAINGEIWRPSTPALLFIF